MPLCLSSLQGFSCSLLAGRVGGAWVRVRAPHLPCSEPLLAEWRPPHRRRGASAIAMTHEEGQARSDSAEGRPGRGFRLIKLRRAAASLHGAAGRHVGQAA